MKEDKILINHHPRHIIILLLSFSVYILSKLNSYDICRLFTKQGLLLFYFPQNSDFFIYYSPYVYSENDSSFSIST